MSKKAGLAVLVAATAIATPALAQDAAETAVIMSGTGANQAKASRSLGSAISQSVNSSADVVRQSGPAPRRSNTRRNRRGNVPSAPTVIASGDALEGTDASAYRVGSGATIKVSGGFRPSHATECQSNCPAKSGATD